MSKLKSLWVLGVAVGIAGFAAFGVPLNATATPVPVTTTSATTTVASPVGPVTYDCKTNTVNFVLQVPAGNVTVSYTLPDGSGISMSFATAHTVPISDPLDLVNGTYNVTVKELGATFTPSFTVACTTPSPTTTTTTPKPECVTLTAANIDYYGDLTGNRQTSVTITLKGHASDYCNDWAFVGVGYTISNPANVWNPAQVVAFVSSKVVGKSGLTATATVPSTTCGQNDFYEGVGPKVGDKLPGQGQGYEATHKFLSQLFGGAPTWYQNVSKCATVTPSPSATVTPTTPKPSETKPTATVPTSSASSSSPAAVVAVATCSAGKVLVGGNCVTPKIPDTGSTGTPLMTTISNAAPLGVAALVLGVGGLLYRRMTRVA